jgi:amidase
VTELHELTATEQVDAIASGATSSVELVEHYLHRIERHDPDLGAFVTVLADHARESAREADRAVADGEPLGPLHGLPLALKDLHASAGLRTTFGCKAFADFVPPTDAPAIANLRAAGAVVIGKTNVPEFGPTCYTDNALGPVTRNPYAPELSPSGSSGGSAAAVAAGLVGIAHASDGLGSIRTPAANCGLIGFKTSRGRTAGSGAGFLAFGVEGSVARTVADAALFLDAMGGPSASDLWHLPSVRPDAFRTALLAPPPAGLRVGRMVTAPTDVDVHPECVYAVDATAAALAGLGCLVEDVPADSVPAAPEVRQAVLVMLGAAMSQIAEAVLTQEQRESLMPYTRWLIENNTGSATDYANAQAVLAGAAARSIALVDRYDLLLTPTTTAPPLSNAELRSDDGPESFAVMGRWSAFTPAANIGGLPAVSLPVHATPSGVPIGAQLMAPRFHDELLMSVTAALEPAFRWQDRHPPNWG